VSVRLAWQQGEFEYLGFRSVRIVDGEVSASLSLVSVRVRGDEKSGDDDDRRASATGCCIDMDIDTDSPVRATPANAAA